MKSVTRPSHLSAASSAASHAVLLCVGCCIFTAALVPCEARAAGLVQDAPPAPPPSNATARRIAVEIGLDAAALAAVGVDAEGCAAIVQRLVDATVGLDGLEQTKAALAVAADALEEARQSAQDGSGDAAAGIPQRELAVQNAAAAVAAVRSVLRGIALEGLDPAVVVTLDAIDAGRKRRVPTEFLVVSRSEAGWEMLERAVRQEARSQRTGEPLDPQYAGLLAAARAHPEVAAASASLAALLPSVEAALVAE